jgi:hypothetical protein
MDKENNILMFQELIKKDGHEYCLQVDKNEDVGTPTYVLTIFEFKRFLFFKSKKSQILRTVAESENATFSAMVDLGKRYINTFN